MNEHDFTLFLSQVERLRANAEMIANRLLFNPGELDGKDTVAQFYGSVESLQTFILENWNEFPEDARKVLDLTVRNCSEMVQSANSLQRAMRSARAAYLPDLIKELQKHLHNGK